MRVACCYGPQVPDIGEINGHIFNDARDNLLRRADAAGFDYKVTRWRRMYERAPEDDTYFYQLEILFPRGRNAKHTRTLYIDELHAEEFDSLPFESMHPIGPYRGLYNKEANTVEVLLETPAATQISIDSLYAIPGMLFRSNNPSDSAIYASYLDLPLADTSQYLRVIGDHHKPFGWYLPIAAAPAPCKIEISPISQDLERFIDSRNLPREAAGRITLKVSGWAQTRPEQELVEWLEGITSSIFFELDLRFNLLLQLVRHAPTEQDVKVVGDNGQPVSYPKVQYAKVATTLYFYGKSAVGAPLLRYLAYYQAIEHFWPTFTTRHLLQHVRNELSDPRFDKDSDRDIQRLVRQATINNPNASSETRQLIKTLEVCIDMVELREYINAIDGAVTFLSLHAANGGIAGVPLINFSEGKTSLIEQVGERIYKIRCRIAHAKEGWSDGEAPPLLPYSEDAQKLDYDLRVIEYLCQEVIIAGSGKVS